ncbi:MAG: molybdate ABC transporter substrate-binding protein [Rhodobacterales bacterium]|nr:MAG: molybdate ABC transporter substrate-binding protein [Rhodobacterales bacterium]
MLRALALLLSLLPALARAETLRVAVASNFLPAAQEIAAIMTDEGWDVRLSGGATGALYAQIRHGAPFDLFLAADQARPAALEAEGRGTAQPYAVGRLVLWSADPALIGEDPVAALRGARVIAIANPDLAPYGRAGAEVLDALGLAQDAPLVMGQNIGQTAGLVATGNAPLGFLAAALTPVGGSRWDVPGDLHAPIRQDMIVLSPGPGAERFIAVLQSDEGRALLEDHGYDAPEAVTP